MIQGYGLNNVEFTLSQDVCKVILQVVRSIVVFEKKIKKISLYISIFNFEPLGGRSIDPDVKVLKQF